MSVRLLLLCSLLWAGAAFAGLDDDPLPPGTKITILNVTGGFATIQQPQITTIAGATQSLGGSEAAVAPPSTVVIPSVKELSASGQGISAREDAHSIKIDLAADILFDFDRADLRASAETSLQKIAQLIAARAKQGVLIEGHTDAKGSNDYNKKLSLARAETVRQWFMKNMSAANIPIKTAGYGASRPVAPNTKPDGSDDPEGRQKNRRVQITINK